MPQSANNLLRLQTGQDHRNFCKDITLGRRKSAIMRCHGLRVNLRPPDAHPDRQRKLPSGRLPLSAIKSNPDRQLGSQSGRLSPEVL